MANVLPVLIVFVLVDVMPVLEVVQRVVLVPVITK